MVSRRGKESRTNDISNILDSNERAEKKFLILMTATDESRDTDFDNKEDV
jgi:hypothetical protein